MKQKTLSGIEPVHNQVRDTAAGLPIHHSDPQAAMDIYYLVLLLGLTLMTTISCGAAGG
jgi:hypothetical protein